jgi:hypothetical protein
MARFTREITGRPYQKCDASGGSVSCVIVSLGVVVEL